MKNRNRMSEVIATREVRIGRRLYKQGQAFKVSPIDRAYLTRNGDVMDGAVLKDALVPGATVRPSSLQKARAPLTPYVQPPTTTPAPTPAAQPPAPVATSETATSSPLMTTANGPGSA